jgi:prephenate dehydratase
MVATASIKVCTLGGPETFAGQATDALRKLYPEFSEPTYLPGGPDMWAALFDGSVDAIVGAEEVSSHGFSEINNRVATANVPLYVLAELALPFACSLLAKPGSSLQNIRHVFGGPVSFFQCEAFLKENLPKTETSIYTEPITTGDQVLAGDGSLAMLGSYRLADRMGLVELATGIDNGAYGNWWAVSTIRWLSDKPDRLVIGGRFNENGQLGRLIESMAKVGFRPSTIYPHASGQALFEYDYVIRFLGSGTRAAVEEALTTIDNARLIGAMEARER